MAVSTAWRMSLTAPAGSHQQQLLEHQQVYYSAAETHVPFPVPASIRQSFLGQGVAQASQYSQAFLGQGTSYGSDQTVLLGNTMPPPTPQAGQMRQRRQPQAQDPNIRRIRHATASTDRDESGVLAAVVVTIARGMSYDQLFQTVPQQGDGGNRVSTYSATGRSLPHLLRALAGNASQLPSDGLWRDFQQLLADMRAVEPKSVVFNWECCSGCCGEAFGEQHEGPHIREVVLNLMHLLLQRGHMVMCSDYSLKALIKQWSERRFGPNPFVKIGEFGGKMKVQFDPRVLESCPSAQLQKAGQLCEEGSAELHAMSGTIAYTIDSIKADTPAYKLEVLTVATAMDGINLSTLATHLTCKAGANRGAAGHVLLRYPSGGILLVSAGHWVELAHIGVSEERLLQVATTSYGVAYSANVRSQFASCATQEARSQLVQSLAQQYVQQSAPCTYSA